MEESQGLSARLPAPRDDEPQGLRQDIIDELADHLACSAQRELLRGADPATARARVLERFGDPAALARRLWLDAMRGKVMAQRMVIGTCVFVTAVSLGLVGLLYQMAIDARRMAALQAAKAQAGAAEARAREQEMLKRLGEMSEAIKHPRSLDWNPVRIKVTEETTDGPPVPEASISLVSLRDNPPNWIRKVTDASGLADFGLVQPGEYRLNISKQWDDGFLSALAELNVQPGSDVTKSIACPKTPPLRVGVRVRWQWPADLEKEALWLYARFVFRSRELGPGNRWSIRRSMAPEGASGLRNTSGAMLRFQGRTPRHDVLCGPANKTSEFLDDKVPFFWNSDSDQPANQKDAASKLASGAWATVLEKELRELAPGAAIEMEVGEYALSQLLVLRPSVNGELAPGQRGYDVLVITRHSAAQPSGNRAGSPANGGNPERWRDSAFDPRPMKPPLELPEQYWVELREAFEARLEQPNEWKIPLPDELI
jgi:hypothetical protein